MLELEATKDLGGVPVSFQRLAPGGFIVVDVNGRHSLVSKEQWKSLPSWETSARQGRRSLLAPSYEAWVMAVLFVVMCISCSIAFSLAAIGSMTVNMRRLLRGSRKTREDMQA